MADQKEAAQIPKHFEESEESDEGDAAYANELGDNITEIAIEGGPEPDDGDEEDGEEDAGAAQGGDGLADSVKDFLTHTDAVYAVAFNAAGTSFVSGGGDDVAYIWNVDSVDPKVKLEGHKDSIVDVAYSTDGKYIATGCLDATVIIWDAQTGTKLHQLEGPSESVECLQWHPKGPLVVAGGGDGMVWLWNAEKGQNMSVLSGHAGPVVAASFTSDGKKIVTASEDSTVRVWDPRSTKPLAIIQGYGFHEEPITSMSLHSDGVHVATGGVDGRAYVANINTGKPIGELKGHEDSIEDIAFVSNFPWVVTGSLDSTIGVWDITTQQQRHSLKNDAGITTVVTSGLYILSGDVHGAVKLWDMRQGGAAIKTWQAHHAPILDIAVQTDKKTFLTSSEDNAVRLFAL